MFSVAYADQPSWCIQIIRCSTLENAEAVYAKMGQPNKTIEQSKGSFTVNVGSYKNKSGALAELAHLKASYPDAFIRKCRPPDQPLAEKTKAPIKTSTSHKVHAKAAPSPPVTAKPPLAKSHKAVEEEKGPLPIKQKEVARKEPPLPADPKDVAGVGEKPETPQALPDKTTALLKTGMQSYEDKKYAEAISALSQYVSLSPTSEHGSAALFIIGKSFEDMGKPIPALKIFGRVLEKYPKSPEAFTAMIAMADVSVKHPSLNYPVFMKGAEYVKDPVMAYDKAIALKIPDPLAQAIRLKKGRALLKQGRHQKSYEVCLSVLYDFPLTSYKIEIMDMLRENAIALIDSYHRTGDHIAAMNMFFAARDKNLIDYDDTDTMLASAVSSAHIGMYDASATVLKQLRLKKENAKSPRIDQAEQAIEGIRTGHYAVDPSPDERWKLYETGRAYLEANEPAMAEKTMTPLRAMGGDPFWARITDYALEGHKWKQTYEGFVNKK
jgi:tetratricopeptide (TPR) repeat protein